jgi:hypothetical protein
MPSIAVRREHKSDLTGGCSATHLIADRTFGSQYVHISVSYAVMAVERLYAPQASMSKVKKPTACAPRLPHELPEDVLLHIVDIYHVLRLQYSGPFLELFGV